MLSQVATIFRTFVYFSFEKTDGTSSCSDDVYTKKCTVCGYETNEEDEVDIP